MAQKKKIVKSDNETTVTRIKASDSSSSTKKAPKTEAVSAEVVDIKSKDGKTKAPRKKRSAKGIARPFVAFGQYFSGAWFELKQVRWPTRRATWGLTFAVLVYSAFFIVVVLLLDTLFKYLFELMLGK